MRPVITVIVPVRGEAPPGASTLAPLRGEPIELLVAAAADDTPEATRAAWRAAGARVLSAAGPRGARLAAAAEEARGDVLLFLHADTVLPPAWRSSVERAVAEGAASGAFRLGFAETHLGLSAVAAVANARTRLTRVPYGDQAPFVTSVAYRRAGGHPPWPLLDDLVLSRRLRAAGPVALLPEAVATSGRRYLSGGIVRTVLRNWTTLVRFRLGATPETLAAAYRKR